MKYQLENVALGAVVFGAFALFVWGLFWLMRHHHFAWLLYGIGAVLLLVMMAVTGQAMRDA